MEKKIKLLTYIFGILLIWAGFAQAAEEKLKVIESKDQTVKSEKKLVLAEPMSNIQNFDPTKYTLGPDDVVEITVMRHTEFSGIYPVNMEGKIQYKFVGDMDVTGLTKKGLEDKIKTVISAYVINPDVNVAILDYKSKVIYVLGEVGQPGKYFMRSESIPIREAVVNAGLPTLSASMRRCILITPDKSGNPKRRSVDLYAVLYGGNLKKNVEMKPGDVLYVPATVMAKIIRVISPVTQTVGVTASAPGEASTARSSITSFAK